MKDISATEASRNFSKLLDEVQKGRSFHIVRGGERVATVTPVKRHTGAELIAIYERRGPDPELADAIEEGRRFILDQEPRYLDGP
jgi:prevent-host-death family protein